MMVGFQSEVLGFKVPGLNVGFAAWVFDVWSRNETPFGFSCNASQE